MTKPKTNRAGDRNKSHKMDQCQTPWYGVDPLLPYLNKGNPIWDPACGKGHIVDKLKHEGFVVRGTDVLNGDNFFDYRASFGVIVTNPPYSSKYDWIEHCYHLGCPWAMLMPLETLGASKGQKLFEKYGMELIVLDKRINFYMPNKGYEGSAHFPTAWFTHGLGIGKMVTYAKITRYPDGQPGLFDKIQKVQEENQCEIQIHFHEDFAVEDFGRALRDAMSGKARYISEPKEDQY